MIVFATERAALMSIHDSDAAQPALDAAALAKLTKLDPTGQTGLLKRVLSAYASSLGRLRQQLDGMAEEPNMRELGMGVHTLKSSSASVGALHLSGLCANIEQAARTGLVDGIADQVEQLRVEMDRVDQAIQHMLANPVNANPVNANPAVANPVVANAVKRA
jgi:HPt (histidine-containing phosphotransfer) domain-containing protein